MWKVNSLTFSPRWRREEFVVGAAGVCGQLRGVSHEPSANRTRALTGLNPSALVRLGMTGSSGEAPIDVPGYEMLESLGRGGMGEVFRARQESLGREVAVKILRADLPAAGWLPERFEQEARTMAALQHPHVVTVHDCVRLDDGRVAIVMELVSGGSLRTWLNGAPGGLPLAQVLRWAREIAAGLRAAHEAGLVHRDVKPDNVLIDDTGAARVSDFGLAFSTLPEAARLTQTGATPGTPGYMPPETWRGEAADARSDIFSYGALLYEMLTGRLPQGSFPPAKSLRPEVPAAVDRAILAALRPVAAERPPDMSAMLHALTEMPSPFTRRRIIAAGTAAVAAVAGGGWWWKSRKKEMPGDSTEPVAPRWQTIAWPADPARFAVCGGWKVENGVLFSDDTICILPLAREFPASCRLRLRFTRLAGEVSVGVFFRTPRGTGVCTLDGRMKHLGGVQSVNGEVLNPTTAFFEKLQNGRSYEWVIELRPDRVRMWLDGVLRNDRDITDAELSVPDTWAWKPQPGSPALLLGTWESPSRFEWVEWYPLE